MVMDFKNNNNNEFDLINYLAIQVLEQIGIDKPSQAQIDMLEQTLKHPFDVLLGQMSSEYSYYSMAESAS